MFSLYVHIPFCVRRCIYCDFITYANQQSLLPEYVNALLTEIRYLAEASNCTLGKVETIYFGGGTPSLLSPQQIQSILENIAKGFGISSDAEITLEANPGTASQAHFSGIRATGINRLSLGVQAFDPADLQTLRRIHTVEDVYKSVENARRGGFSNLNLDLIFGLPGQTLSGWDQNLEKALALKPEHLSLYSLIVEDGTVLAKKIQAGELERPDEDLSADMFEMAMAKFEQNGFDHYEISNWAVSPKFESRHNKTYWKNEAYLGIGAGAHGCIGKYRLSNKETIPEYINCMAKSEPGIVFPFSPATKEHVEIDRKTAMQETMMLGLRLTREGVSLKAFQDRFGVKSKVYFSKEIQNIIDKGLAEWVQFQDGEHLRLTHLGTMLGNQAFMEFV